MNFRKISVSIEELILIFLILLNIFDFLEVLPADMDYAKKIISWTALGYLFYKISLTKIFFGLKNKVMDLLIVTAYFFFVFKNFIGYTLSAYEEAVKNANSMVFPLYSFLMANNGYWTNVFEHWAFYLGGIGIILLAVYCAFKFDIKEPSLLHVIQESGKPKNIWETISRSAVIFFVMVAFFQIIFSLVMEWLAIAIDAPLLVLGIFFYIFEAKKFSARTIIYKLGNIGEKFYENFIKLFYSKEKILLGVLGILVLHLLTDIGNFIIPYVVGLKDVLYFKQLGIGHAPIAILMLKDIQSAANFLDMFFIPWLYLLNLVAILFLLLTPAFLWWQLFKEKKIKIHNSLLGLFFASLFVYLLKPAFTIKPITIKNLMGVDILTQSILSPNIAYIGIASILIGIFVYFLASIVKKALSVIGVAAIIMFFIKYVYFYFISIYSYFVVAVISLLKNSEFFIAFYFFSFLVIIILFYISGTIVFLLELRKIF